VKTQILFIGESKLHKALKHLLIRRGFGKLGFLKDIGGSKVCEIYEKRGEVK
jgi:hypothetical protein